MHPTSGEPATLPDYELVFDHPGMPLVEPVFANVKPTKGKHVCGVLYHMTREEMSTLNKTEGGGAYQNLELKVEGTQSGRVVAHVFWSPNTGITHLKPSRRYIDVLVAGAKEHGLSHGWDRFLQNHVTSPHYFILPHLMRVVMPILFMLYKLGMKRPFRKWREKQHQKTKMET
jgi:hypothetical protein